MELLDWLDAELLNNTVMTWATAAALATAVALALAIVRRVIRSRLKKLAGRSQSMPLHVAEEAVRNTKGWFLLLMGLFAGSRLLELSGTAGTTFARIAIIGLVIQMGIWAAAALSEFLTKRRERQIEQDPGAVAALDVMGFVLRLAVWSIVLLLILDNLGVNITALVAGLGVGGIAVALAAQNILGDLFASLSIVLDKPFVVGDFVNVGDMLGNVEKVGLKTTRVCSLSGEQLIFSNNDLLSSRIRNYGRMYRRRVVFSLGVTYQTTAEQLRLIPKIIREAIESQDRASFDRAHFQKYGDFALIFEAVFYVESPEYNTYMDIQQAVNLIIFERFEKEGIEFAYPTQTLFLNQSNAPATADGDSREK